MSDSPRTDYHDTYDRRTSPATYVVIALGLVVLAAVGYDLYLRNQTAAVQEQTAADTTQQTRQLQQQLTDAMARVTQSDQNAQVNEQDKVMWMSLARASAGVLATR